MSKIFILILMIFCHIVDDYYLQGWLVSAKQKSWWQENAPQKLYKHDYIVALIMHSFSWAFMIMLPIAFNIGFNVNDTFLAFFIGNMIAHAATDNAKANDKIINLIIDQIVHILQIVWTWLCLVWW